MSFQKYNSGNILTNHSKKIGEFQKNIEELQHFNTKFDGKIRTLVKDFNETISNINGMFVEKSVDVLVKINHNFEKSILPKNSVSKLFGSSLCQTQDNIIVGDPLNNSVHIYHKNQYNHYAEQQVIKYSEQTDVTFQSISVSNGTLVISALDEKEGNKGYLYIYTKGQDLWEKQQVLELNSSKNIKNINLQIENDIIIVLLNGKTEETIIKSDNDLNTLFIYEKNKENKFEQIKTFNYGSYFSLHEKTLAVYSLHDGNHIFIYDCQNQYSEVQKITVEKYVNDLCLFENKLLIFSDVIELYERDPLSNWSKSQDIVLPNHSTKDLSKITMNKNTLIIAEGRDSIHENENKQHCVLYIYKLDRNNEWKMLRTIHFEKKMRDIQTQLSLLENNIVVSNYHLKDDSDSDIYVVSEYANDIKWRGEYFAYMNKVDIQITGEYFSDNLSPHFTLKLDKFKLPQLKKDFYYKNIPNISINIYDLDDDSYRNDLKISNISFSQEGLEFFIKNIHSVPYNFVFNIDISYLAN